MLVSVFWGHALQFASNAPDLPMQAGTSAVHSVTSASDAPHHNILERGATMSEMGAHLGNNFPQHALMSAFHAHHQNVLQQGALTSASGTHLHTTPYQGAVMSSMGAHQQNLFS
uniref:Uncharacterized protein n=1 Tax=Romanomermis culicivorax TaxID=13658 RepID=A0A915L234_ROMCU